VSQPSVLPVSTIDFAAIKQRQQRMWGSGDYAAVAATIQYLSERLCEAVDLRAGQRVLDVATGSGNAALAAARRLTDVVGLDYVPALLARAERRAEAEGLALAVTEGDAEALPFPDASFDVVLSAVGVMFAPNQAQAARELVRVCRPGGTIGLANWTPDGFVGEMLRLVGRYVPPPPGLASPTRWGTVEGLRELFGEEINVQITPQEQLFRFRSPEQFADFFRAHYGPIERAFAAIDAETQARLHADLVALATRWNTAEDGTLVAPCAYLEVVARRA
jgi:SAM-dependent methyltransferase